MLAISAGQGQGQGASVKLYGMKRSIIVRFHSPLIVIYSWVKVGEYVSRSSLQQHLQLRLTALNIKNTKKCACRIWFYEHFRIERNKYQHDSTEHSRWIKRKERS